MFRGQQILVAMAIFLTLVMGCSTTQMGSKGANWYLSQNNVGGINLTQQGSSRVFLTDVNSKLSELNASAELVEVGSNFYDIVVNWNVNPYRLLKWISNPITEDEAAGTIAGVMVVIAAVVGDEVANTGWNFRNLVYEINGVRFAHIPLARCKRLMPLIENNLVYTAVEEFCQHITVYKF